MKMRYVTPQHYASLTAALDVANDLYAKAKRARTLSRKVELQRQAKAAWAKVEHLRDNPIYAD